jgi:hypothetical protein
MQDYFQCHVDEGANGDDTFKFVNHVYVGSKGKQKNKPFTASWTSTNLGGKIPGAH